jgi:hypothetical protein
MAEGSRLNRLEAALLAASAALSENRWALVGGLAVSARCEPRFTRDIDLAVAVAGDSEAEALVRTLQGAGYRVLVSVEQEAVKRLATVQDAIDLQALVARIDDRERAHAREGVERIMARGFARGRDLDRQLQAVLAQSV